ncbi:MAG: glycosyltransferase family 4 protein [Fimbriimonadales bacterium]
MRILQVTADGNPGGGVTMVLGILEHLARKGADVILVVDEGSYAAKEAVKMGVKTIELPFFRSRFDRETRRRLAETVRSVSPDVIHLHGTRAAFFALGGLKGLRARTAYTVHGYHFHRKNALAAALAIQAERMIARAVGEVVFVCKNDQDLATRLRILPSGKPTCVIYNGVRVEDLPRATGQDKNRVGFLGRLVRQKDPELIGAIALLLLERGYEPLIIGGGEEEPVVRRILGGETTTRATITGMLPKEEALKALSTCGAMILPSRWEGFPVSILEAMGMGVPVIAAAVNGVPEAVRDGETGFLVSGRTAEDFCAPLEALKDEALRARITDAALRLVRKQFSMRACTAAHEELYARLAKRSMR